MTIPAIVLAAGASRRLGRRKQLLELAGETLLGRTIRLARNGGADPVLVVVGASAETICASVPLEQAVVVLNSDWREGLASSIRAGIRIVESCAPHAAGVLLLTCDQPRLSSDHLLTMLNLFRENEGSATIASTYGGGRGTPAIFPRSEFPKLLALKGDKGARGILADPRATVVEVPLEGGEIDIDTPADLDRLA